MSFNRTCAGTLHAATWALASGLCWTLAACAPGQPPAPAPTAPPKAHSPSSGGLAQAPPAPTTVETSSRTTGEASSLDSFDASTTSPDPGESTTAVPDPTESPQPREAPTSNPAPLDPLSRFQTLPPRCTAKATYCTSIHLHVVVTKQGPVVSPEWIRDQIVQVHRHFAPIGVQMQVDQVSPLPPEVEHIATRSHRDALGEGRFSRGVAHVFVVGRLDNVDDPGEIRGVHWRQRNDRSRRWVILSKISSDRVLTHELGHFFGLPHSTEAISLMNKTPRDDPPWESRTFSEKEHRRMRRHRDKMLKSGMLVDPRGTPDNSL